MSDTLKPKDGIVFTAQYARDLRVHTKDLNWGKLSKLYDLINKHAISSLFVYCYLPDYCDLFNVDDVVTFLRSNGFKVEESTTAYNFTISWD